MILHSIGSPSFNVAIISNLDGALSTQIEREFFFWVAIKLTLSSNYMSRYYRVLLLSVAFILIFVFRNDNWCRCSFSHFRLLLITKVIVLNSYIINFDLTTQPSDWDKCASGKFWCVWIPRATVHSEIWAITIWIWKLHQELDTEFKTKCLPWSLPKWVCQTQ